MSYNKGDSETNTPAMSLSYTILRLIVLGFGIVTLLAVVIGPLLDYRPGSWQTNIVAGIAVVVAYVLPYRWAVTTPFFYIRLATQVLALARSMYMDALLLSGVYGEKHWSIYPASAVFMFVICAAPFLLIIRRR